MTTLPDPPEGLTGEATRRFSPRSDGVPTVVTVGGGAAAAALPPSGDDLLRARLLAGGGARVGRFTVVRQLDQGGMGLIFVARDDELDRQVALKILRARHADANGRVRLLREAQALARLSHPNVVTVYEVGEFEGHVFVAMELVTGRTLRAWCRERARSWREIVGMYVQAGRGLAAAHAAGIIHRDFKPVNVLVGDDGRVRVVDFGLARAPGGGPEDAVVEAPLGRSTGSVSVLRGDALTVAGALAGSPAYMAPEQLVGGELDHRVDQYSFCVALVEALYGERPVRGKTVEERLQDLIDRPRPDLPRTSKVPKFLRAAILRGLAADPAARFPSMGALLAAIDRDPVRRRVQIAALVAAGLALVLVGFFTARREPVSCQGVDAEVVGLWGGERREAVRAAIEATGVHHAAATWERLGPRLDAYAGSWGALRRDSCVAHGRGERSDELYGRQLACLQRRRSAFDALVASLLGADEAVVTKAVRAADDLPEVSRCDDLAALTAAIPPPDDPAVAVEVEALRDQLESARVAASLRQGREGLAIALPIQARARELGYLAFIAEVDAVAGGLHNEVGDYATGEAELTDAVWIADQIGDDELLARAMGALIHTVGVHRGRYDEALWWSRHVESVRARLPAGSVAGVWLPYHLGVVHYQRGGYDEAIELLGRAQELMEVARGPDDESVAKVLNVRGAIYFRKGDLAAARGLFERGLAIEGAALGPDHPDLATPLGNLGAVAGMSGDYAGSLVYLERALAILERVHGPDHPGPADKLNNICATYAYMKEFTRARAACERGLAILERVHGPEHPALIDNLENLGTIARVLGDLPAARAYSERSLRIGEKALPADHPALATVLLRLGQVEGGEARPRAALPHLERALVIFDKRRDVLDAKNLAIVQYELVGVLRALGRAPRRQRALAEAAVAGMRALGPGFDQERATLERFLAEGAKKKRSKKAKKKSKKAAKK